MVIATLRVEKERTPSRSRGSDGGDADGLLHESKPATVDHADDYSRHSAWDIARSRCGWLITFCLGLLVSALIVQRFEDLLEHHVQLSFFVPLIMGHGGNTGSQTVSTIIRALALRQIGQRDLLRTLVKEALAGALMGGLIGVAIMLVSLVWPHLGPGVGITVGLSLPIISLWANGVGALLTLAADRLKLDPAVTSVPLMTTLVDATGLIIYFYIAELFMGVSAHAAAAHAAAGTGAKVATAAAAAAAAAGAASKAAASSSGKAAAQGGAGKAAAAAAAKAAKKLLSPPPPGRHGDK